MKGFLIVLNLLVVLFITVGAYSFGYSHGSRTLEEKLINRCDWNEHNGTPPDFVLTIKYKDNGTTFCPSFVVHPIGRLEDIPRNMDRIIIMRGEMEIYRDFIRTPDE